MAIISLENFGILKCSKNKDPEMAKVNQSLDLISEVFNITDDQDKMTKIQQGK